MFARTLIFPRKKPRVKIKIFLAAALIIAAVIFFAPRATAKADEVSSSAAGEKELMDNIEELLSELDTGELEEYLNGLNEDILSGKSLSERVLQLISGDYKMDYSSLFNAVLSLFFDEAAAFLPVFSLILAVCVFMSVMNAVKGSFLSDGISDIIHYVCFSVVLILSLTALIPAINECKNTVTSLKTQIEIVCPILITLMAASGGTVSAAVYQPAAAFLSGGICEAVTDVIFPLAILITALSVVGGISGKISVNGFCSLFKSANKWVIGACVTLFSLFLTVQGITSAGYDGISLRALKYAVSSGVPMVGGMISSGADLVLAGSALIKNSVGAVAVFAVAAAVVKPLILLASLTLSLRFIAAAVEPLSSDVRISSFLNGTADNLRYFTAGVLTVALTYFVTLILLICSSGVIF